MRLRFQDIERTVRARHGGGGPPSSLLGRLKNLQRLGLPAGANPGAGAPVEYRLEQLLQVLLAFELMEAGQPPSRVVELVEANWAAMLAALVLAWARRGGGSASPRRYIAIASSALAATDAVPGAAADDRGSVLMDEDAVLGWLRGEPDGGPPSLLLIDPERVVLGVTQELPALAIADGVQVDAAFVELGAATLGGSHPRMWRLPAPR